MSEELCLWIGQELDEKDLAQSLRSVLLGNGSLSDFTELILRSCGYCSEDTIRHIRSVLLDMQNKSVFECSKIRADRYMESEKYVKSGEDCDQEKTAAALLIFTYPAVAQRGRI